MATAAPSEPKITECVVCKEELTEPKVIPCGHVLCKRCVSSCLKSKAGASCPMCRFSIVDPEEHERETSAEVIDGRLTRQGLAKRVHKMNTAGPVINASVKLAPRVKRLDSSTTLTSHAKRVSSVKRIIDPQAVSQTVTQTGVEKASTELGKVTMVPVNTEAQPAILRFHENHGENIVLSNNQQTAERRGGGCTGGIVVSSDSMIPGMLYEVLLNRRKEKIDYYLRVGVTTTAPDMLTLPDSAWNWPSAIYIRDDRVCVLNKEEESSVGQKLLDMPEGSRIGLMIDTARSLHLYIDGQHQGVAATGVPDPCFALFELYGPYREITALPVTVPQ